jgi:hypothetical protein
MAEKELFFDKLFKAGHIKDQPAGSPIRTVGEGIIEVFDEIVHFHRSIFPNQHIRRLMSMVWQIVGNRVTPVAVVQEKLFGLHFYCEASKGGRASYILVPIHWQELVKANPIFQCGGMVFTASQVQDFYNDKLGELEMKSRARAYEDEFLNTIKTSVDPQYKLNEYQQKIVDAYPQGLESLPPGLLYESKPWTSAN